MSWATGKPRDYPANRSRSMRDAENKDSQSASSEAAGRFVDWLDPREELAWPKLTNLWLANCSSATATKSPISISSLGRAAARLKRLSPTALTNNKDGFTSLLAVLAPNLPAKPSTVMFNKVTIKGAKQAVQMFGPAQHAVAKAVADSVADGTIPAAEADDIFICVGVFIHWDAADDKKIHDFNYRAVKELIERAVSGKPTPAEVVAQRDSAKHPFSP